jgi:hypothetical protein
MTYAWPPPRQPHWAHCGWLAWFTGFTLVHSRGVADVIDASAAHWRAGIMVQVACIVAED